LEIRKLNNAPEGESVFFADELGESELEDEYDDEVDSESSSVVTQSEGSEFEDDDGSDDEEDGINLVPITPDDPSIDRTTKWQLIDTVTDNKGKEHEHWRIISQGSFPMISSHQQQSFFDEKMEIFNKSGLEAYDKNFIKLMKLQLYLSKQDQETRKKNIEELETEVPEPNENVARIIGSLGVVVEKFQTNLNDLIDPPVESTRKARRLQRRKMANFKLRGYRQLIIVIEQYIKGLKNYGQYPESMWKEFEIAKTNALKAISEDEVIEYGTQILVSAEFVLDEEEEVKPIRRINEGIAQPNSQLE
jgi:hypothetical protein